MPAAAEGVSIRGLVATRRRISRLAGEKNPIYDRTPTNEHHHDTAETPTKENCKTASILADEDGRAGAWRKARDPETESIYYFHTKTMETSWDMPDDYFSDADMSLSEAKSGPGSPPQTPPRAQSAGLSAVGKGAGSEQWQRKSFVSSKPKFALTTDLSPPPVPMSAPHFDKLFLLPRAPPAELPKLGHERLVQVLPLRQDRRQTGSRREQEKASAAACAARKSHSAAVEFLSVEEEKDLTAKKHARLLHLQARLLRRAHSPPSLPPEPPSLSEGKPVRRGRFPDTRTWSSNRLSRDLVAEKQEVAQRALAVAKGDGGGGEGGKAQEGAKGRDDVQVLLEARRAMLRREELRKKEEAEEALRHWEMHREWSNVLQASPLSRCRIQHMPNCCCRLS